VLTIESTLLTWYRCGQVLVQHQIPDFSKLIPKIDEHIEKTKPLSRLYRRNKLYVSHAHFLTQGAGHGQTLLRILEKKRSHRATGT
jgi:hypothetical protein